MRPARLVPLLLAVALLGLSACGVGEADVAAYRADTLEQSATVIQADIADLLRRASRALDDIEPALATAPTQDARFGALEHIRQTFELDGLRVDGPSEADIWAGRSVDPIALPAPPPWNRSFRHGAVRYHEGPFIRALVVERTGVRGGTAYATFVLDEQRPGELDFRPFRRRWLEPLGLKQVTLHAPDLAPPLGAEETGRKQVAVPGPKGAPALVAELAVRGPLAVEETLAGRQARWVGIALLLLLAVLAVGARQLVVTRVPNAAGQGLLLGILVLLLRQALFWIDLPGRFEALAPLFAPDRFSVETPLGWLGSPADFFLSACAWLLFTLYLRRAEERTRVIDKRVIRLAFVSCAPFLAALVAGLWLLLVERTVFGGQATFFEARSFLPPPDDALLLAGLVVITALAFVFTSLVMRHAWRAWPADVALDRRFTLGLSALVLTGCVAAFVGSGGWVALGIPLLVILLVGRAKQRPPIGAPSQILLMSVLATVLLLPVLWVQVERRTREQLDDRLESVLAREAEVLPHLDRALLDLSQSDFLASALRRARDGPRPQGLALALWFMTDFATRDDPGIVTVLDARGRSMDHFALASIPPDMLPAPTPQPQGVEDRDVALNQAEAIRTLVGRLRVRDADGTVLGYVVLRVPDLIDLRLHRLGAGLTSGGGGALSPLEALRGLQVASIRDGQVERADDPSVPKTRDGFGPPGLATLGPAHPDLAWELGPWQCYARWVPERGRAIAVRRKLPGLEDLMLAVARVIAVGVGLGALVALIVLLVRLRQFRPRLHHKILLAFFGISVVPLTLLGGASARDAQQRYDAQLTERLQTDLTRVRGDMRALGPSIFHQARDQKLATWSAIAHHDVLLYGRGHLEATSRRGLVAAELLPSRLPADAYRATVLERRELIRKDVFYAGREVWFGYTPVLDDQGRTRATVAVPLLYDEDRVEAAMTVTGSALLAGYLLAIVLVLVVGIYAARSLTRPLSTLAAGTQRVAAGELDLELPGEGEDELGSLVAAFNAMTRELREKTARAAQVERERAWRRMARQIAHEIRNPLTPMRLMIQQMQAAVARDPSAGPEAIKGTVEVLLKQIDALRKIAGDFANFARQPKRNLKDVDLAAVITHVTTLHAAQRTKGVAVESRVAQALPSVWGDEEELRRVLLNLVANAVQSIRGEGRVVVSAQPESLAGQPGVRLEVADNGVGIPKVDRDRLFDPHFSTKTSGTGLGLAIVARIVQDMGGTIEVESASNRGTTFSLWFGSGTGT